MLGTVGGLRTFMIYVVGGQPFFQFSVVLFFADCMRDSAQ
jgi:hypothetical protein